MDQIKCQRCHMVPEEFIAFGCKHTYCVICLSYSYLQCINDPNFDQEQVELNCDICNKVNKLDYDSQQALEGVLKDILLFNEPEDQSDILSNQPSEKYPNILPPSVLSKNFSPESKFSAGKSNIQKIDYIESPFEQDVQIQQLKNELDFLDMPITDTKQPTPQNTQNPIFKKKTPITFRPASKPTSIERKPSQVSIKLEKCSMHDQEIQFFCFSCENNLCCSQCLSQHKFHKIMTLEKALIQILEMGDFWKDVQHGKTKLEAQNKRLEHMMNAHNEEIMSIQEEVDDRIMVSIYRMQEKQQHIKQQLENLKKQKQNFYQNQLSENAKKIREIKDFLEICQSTNKIKSLKLFSKEFDAINEKINHIQEIQEDQKKIHFDKEVLDEYDEILKRVKVSYAQHSAKKPKLTEFLQSKGSMPNFHKKSVSERQLPQFLFKQEQKPQLTDKKFNSRPLNFQISPKFNIKQNAQPPLEFKFKKFEKVY